MEISKKTSVVVLAGVAVAAGVVAMATFARWRERARTQTISTRLRGAQEVITDCYQKIREIEEHLPEVLRGRNGDSPRAARTNGKPAFDTTM